MEIVVLRLVEDMTRLEFGKDTERIFVEIDNLSVHIAKTDEGVDVTIWGSDEDDFPLASTWATFAEG